MTGHGRGEHAHAGLKVTVEISAVNRKQAEISVNLPRDLEALEPEIRNEINARVSRGRLVVRVTPHSAGAGPDSAVQINVPLARAYARALRRLARELKIADELTLEALLRAPGVLQAEEAAVDPERLWPAVRRALGRALDGLIRMRLREGAHLETDLRRRLAVIRRSVGEIARRAPAASARYREQLLERVRKAGLEPTPEDNERITKEVVFFADRSDIAEELTRMESHFKQFTGCLKSPEPVGRTLDFLAQEMNREINTIGAKANDAAISRHVVFVKAEVERLREQVQNVE